MMKKIIILLAILVCGVGEVKAVKVKFILGEGCSWSNAYIHLYYNDGSGDVNITGQWPGQLMNKFYDNFKSKNWYEIIIDVEEDKLSKLSWIFNNGSDAQSPTISRDCTSQDYFTEIWNANSTIMDYVEPLDYYWYDTSGSFSKMTKSGQIYTTTVDVSSVADKSYILLPSYCTTNESSSIAVEANSWNLALRPNSTEGTDYYINDWQNWTGNALTKYEKNDAWKFSQLPEVTFDFTYNAETKNWTLNPHFTRTINTSVGYSTFSSDYDVAIPEGVTAYYASEANSSTKKVTMTKFKNGIAASTGALLYKSDGGLVKFTPATSTDNVSGSNLLIPTTGSDIYYSSKAQYVLAKAKNSNDVSTIAFKKVGSSYSPAKGSAYLEVNSALAPSFEIFFDDAAGGTTAIDAVKSAEPAVTDGAYYNLAGQRVANPTKGLYIVNGRKVVVK